MGRASSRETKFVLSEKVFRYDEEELEQVRNKKKNSYENIGDNNIFLEEDVKEFIRLLKKELCCDEEVDEYVVETKEQVINKLAGDLGK
jgi:translation initiation factor 2 beta subunit (eIF-2beta)/eIF-5